jgi:hypothetical protein
VHATRRHGLVFFLVLLLLFLSGCKAPANPADPEPTERETPGENEDTDETDDTGETGARQDEAEDIKKEIELIVMGDSLAIRKTPGTKNKAADDILIRLKQGHAVFLQDNHNNQVEADGYIWWEVYDPASQVKGWCAAKHLASIDKQKLGTVEGSITFPSDHIPDGLTVVLEDVATGQSYSTDEIIYDGKYHFGVGFVIKVPPGNYYVYAVDPDFSDIQSLL